MKHLSTETIYNGRIINVTKDHILLDNGTKTVREVVRHSEAVAIVAVDQYENVLMVKQYRYAAGKDLTEIPAGLIDSGENPLNAAKRELKEETGYESRDWRFLTSIYTSPGSHDEIIHIFAAENVEKTSEQHLDTDEILSCSVIPMKELVKDIKNGSLRDAKTIIGILIYFNTKKQAT